MADLANFRLFSRDCESITVNTTNAFKASNPTAHGVWLDKHFDVTRTYENGTKYHDILEGFSERRHYAYDWGLGGNILSQSQHREPNLDCGDLGIKWSMSKLPPQVLACGHRCSYQTALRAVAQNRAWSNTEAELLGRKTTPQYYADIETYTTESVYREQLENQARRGVYGAKMHLGTCCRCALARFWFGLQPPDNNRYYSSHECGCTSISGMYNNQISDKFGTYNYRRIESGKLTQNNTNHPSYADRLNTKHIGWHAGLVRPNILYKNPDSDYRRNMYREIRLVDNLGPINGVPTPRNYLCASCYQVARGLPLELFWVARGMRPRQARRMATWELDTFQKPRFPKSRKRQWLSSMTFMPSERMHDYLLSPAS
jgi:hypothetical protein